MKHFLTRAFFHPSLRHRPSLHASPPQNSSSALQPRLIALSSNRSPTPGPVNRQERCTSSPPRPSGISQVKQTLSPTRVTVKSFARRWGRTYGRFPINATRKPLSQLWESQTCKAPGDHTCRSVPPAAPGAAHAPPATGWGTGPKPTDGLAWTNALAAPIAAAGQQAPSCRTFQPACRGGPHAAALLLGLRVGARANLWMTFVTFSFWLPLHFGHQQSFIWSS